MAKASGEVSALWVTDSGASHNFCNDPSLFQNTTPIKMAIRLGDHSSVNAFYSGIVVLRTTHGTLNLHAIYVPQFRMSLSLCWSTKFQRVAGEFHLRCLRNI
jgi:hypothetical protein